MQSNLFHTPQENKKSKLLTRYQKLIKDIENKKTQQENLRNSIDQLMPRVHTELMPLVNTQNDLFIKRLVRLDQVFSEIHISGAKANLFIDYMIDELETLMQANLGDQETLKALYDKYVEVAFEPDIRELMLTAEVIERETGFAVDIEELAAKGLDEYMADHKDDFSDWNEPKKKKSKKQTKKELLEAEENKMLALDAKAIYIRLIKKYHPDRQQDETKKLEYTEISKNVTKAYQENDFMALLQLQITYLEDAEHDATALADDMLQRYNKILQGQLNELNQELQSAKYASFSLVEEFLDKNYLVSERLFVKKKNELKQNIASIKDDLEQSNIKKKGWFKEYLRMIKINNDMMNDPFYYF